MKRKTYVRMKLGGKFLIITILTLALLVGAVAGLAFYIHHTHTQEETSYLQTQGFVNLVNINDKSQMNLVVKGVTPAKHTLVTIAGMGYSDYGVYMDYITQSLQSENRLVLIDRLGTGYSDDTNNERTCQAIVDEYRKALIKNMIDPPYVLLAHEIGAAYATYWQTMYPEEVEGIIYIDPNPINNSYTPIQPQDNALLMSIGCKLGLQRALYNDLYTPEAISIPNNYLQAATYFSTHSTYTAGYLSEVENAHKNFTTAMSSIQTSDIPKMYINCSYAFETTEEALAYIDYMNEQARSVGQEKVFADPNSDAQQLITASQDMANQINSYVHQLGNCHLVKMPGGPSIYEQYHRVLQTAIVDFIDYLDGTVPALQERYVDKILEQWQQVDEQEIVSEETTEPQLETEPES